MAFCNFYLIIKNELKLVFMPRLKKIAMINFQKGKQFLHRREDHAQSSSEHDTMTLRQKPLTIATLSLTTLNLKTL